MKHVRVRYYVKFTESNRIGRPEGGGDLTGLSQLGSRIRTTERRVVKWVSVTTSNERKFLRAIFSRRHEMMCHPKEEMPEYPRGHVKYAAVIVKVKFDFCFFHWENREIDFSFCHITDLAHSLKKNSKNDGFFSIFLQATSLMIKIKI